MEVYLVESKTARNCLLIALLAGIVWALYFGVKNSLASELLLLAVIILGILLIIKK
jgi:hypothetical protein